MINDRLSLYCIEQLTRLHMYAKSNEESYSRLQSKPLPTDSETVCDSNVNADIPTITSPHALQIYKIIRKNPMSLLTKTYKTYIRVFLKNETVNVSWYSKTDNFSLTAAQIMNIPCVYHIRVILHRF